MLLVEPIIPPTPRPTVQPTVPPPPLTGTPEPISPPDPAWLPGIGPPSSERSISPIRPNPATITPPPVYNGDLPALPLNLSAVSFTEDVTLNNAQRAMLAQNGFVVVSAGFEQFDDAYSVFNENNFVTTDAMLHSLHYVFDNLLTDLEKDLLFDQTR